MRSAGWGGGQGEAMPGRRAMHRCICTRRTRERSTGTPHPLPPRPIAPSPLELLDATPQSKNILGESL